PSPARSLKQQLGVWSHGQVRHSLPYTAPAAGIALVLVAEDDTRTTSPGCGRQYTPRGRVDRCPNVLCGQVAHRERVGAVNRRSRQLRGEPATITPPVLGVTRRLVTHLGRAGGVPWRRGRWLVRPSSGEQPPRFWRVGSVRPAVAVARS